MDKLSVFGLQPLPAVRTDCPTPSLDGLERAKGGAVRRLCGKMRGWKSCEGEDHQIWQRRLRAAGWGRRCLAV